MSIASSGMVKFGEMVKFGDIQNSHRGRCHLLDAVKRLTQVSGCCMARQICCGAILFFNQKPLVKEFQMNLRMTRCNTAGRSDASNPAKLEMKQVAELKGMQSWGKYPFRRRGASSASASVARASAVSR